MKKSSFTSISASTVTFVNALVKFNDPDGYIAKGSNANV